MQLFTFHNKQTKKEEQVEREKWGWEVHYGDGTTLKQFDDSNQTFHQFREIDLSKPIEAFKLTSPTSRRVYTILPPIGAKLIHYYINTIYSAATPSEYRTRTYVFGYELKVAGKTVKVLQIIPPQGTESILVDDDSRLVFE